MGLLSGVINSITGQGSADRAQQLSGAGAAALQGVELPDIEKQKLSLDQYQYLGDYAPLLEQLQQAGPSAMGDVAVDPRLKQQQMDALSQLAGLSQTGLSQADLAALEQTRRAAAAESQAKQGQILQEMAQRGQGGSGAELIARLKSAQSGADRQSAEGLQIARDAQARALQALSQGAGLAGSVRGQEFGEQSDIARARDVVNQFNTQNAQNVQQRNVGGQNQAQAANIQARQELSNQNVGLQNQQQQANKGLLQQQFQNAIQKAGGIAQNYGQQAGLAQQQAANTGTMWANIIGGGAKVASSDKGGGG